MANLDAYLDIPSPSGASFRTLDDASPTPRRTDSPAPARRVNERSRLLDHSEGNEHVGYGVEQAERVERRRRSSSYAVVDTGVSSGVGPAGLVGDDDAGTFSVFSSLPFRRSLLNGHIGYLCSRPTRTFEARGERTLDRELEEANEILRSCHSLDPWLLLVIVRITPLFLRSLQWKERGQFTFRVYFYALL